MEPKKIIKSIDDKMGFTPEIMNMMGEMSPEIFSMYKRCEPCCESQMRSALNHGATKEEILETMNVIFVTSGASGVATCRHALKLLQGKEISGGHGCVPRRKR